MPRRKTASLEPQNRQPANVARTLVALANGATLMRLDRENGRTETLLAHVGMFDLGIVYMGENDGQWFVGYADLQTSQWFHPFQGGWLREEVKR